MPEVVVIAAVGERDRVIGRGLDLPWRIPADLRRFKALTLGHPIVMGRRTFEALLHQNGRPLPDRENVVLTRHPMRVDHPGLHVYGGLNEALAAFADHERVFIGGGGQLYAQVLGADGAVVLADRLELTLVEGAFEGDAFFPPYAHLLDAEGGPFVLEAIETHPAVGDVPAFRFETYRRAR
jgi:dihydrofolate reductase